VPELYQVAVRREIQVKMVSNLSISNVLAAANSGIVARIGSMNAARLHLFGIVSCILVPYKNTYI
jgi:hypothetical protein